MIDISFDSPYKGESNDTKHGMGLLELAMRRVNERICPSIGKAFAQSLASLSNPNKPMPCLVSIDSTWYEDSLESIKFPHFPCPRKPVQIKRNCLKPVPSWAAPRKRCFCLVPPCFSSSSPPLLCCSSTTYSSLQIGCKIVDSICKE